MATNLSLAGGAKATTTATGNVTNNVNVDSGSTLNLGADMNLGGGQVDVENSGSTLNGMGYALTAANLYVGTQERMKQR